MCIIRDGTSRIMHISSSFRTGHPIVYDKSPTIDRRIKSPLTGPSLFYHDSVSHRGRPTYFPMIL